jgi:hypothetical protein
LAARSAVRNHSPGKLARFRQFIDTARFAEVVLVPAAV